MRVSLGGMLLAVSAALALGCGGGPPTQPNPSPNPAPQPSTWTITGTVTTTLTGEPVPGAALNFTNQTVTTDGAGRWTLTGPGTASGTFGVEVSAPAYITRKTAIRAENGRDVTIDLIRDGGPFSLGFYRQFVRNDFDTPGNLRVLRRWTEAPSVYVDIRNPRTGQLTAEEIESIRLAASEAIPVYSGGLFTLQRFEYGAESRPQVAGWINVEISYEPDGNYCGRAFVGSNPGLITMNYDRCFCGSAKLDPLTLRHEFGHAMGFWHVSHASAILNPNPATRPDCRSSAFSDMERHHARIAYSRPLGNADVDWDQLSPSLLQAFLHEPAPVVTCFTR